MKYFKIAIVIFIVYLCLSFDISPNPIEAKGIITRDSCNVRMVSEYVYADIYKDSSIVSIDFFMENLGDSISLEVGFPEMNFQYYRKGNEVFDIENRKKYEIIIDNEKLGFENIHFPEEFDSFIIYENALNSINEDRKLDYEKIEDKYFGLYDKNENPIFPIGKNYKTLEIERHINFINSNEKFENLKSRFGKFSTLDYKFKAIKKIPWYVWNTHFKKGEKRKISVKYKMPSGANKYAIDRYFKYILNTGSKWYKDIGQAEVKLQLHDIDIDKITEISPKGYNIDTQKKTVYWKMKNIEPNITDDIFLQFYNQKDRDQYKIIKYKKDSMRKANMDLRKKE